MSKPLIKVGKEDVEISLAVIDNILKAKVNSNYETVILTEDITVFVEENSSPDLEALITLLNECLYPLAIVEEVVGSDLLGSGIAVDFTPGPDVVKVNANSVTVKIRA